MVEIKMSMLQSSSRRSGVHGSRTSAACVHARTPAVPASWIALHGCIKPLEKRFRVYGSLLAALRVRGRLLHTHIRASLPDDSSSGLSPSSFPSPYTPFSAELLLAVSRLGHLERYRQEVAQFYEPGGAADLTRCGLLISNIISPQLDHRPYYEGLEEYVGRATLAALASFENAEALWDSVLGPVSSSTSSKTCQIEHGDTAAVVPGSTGASQDMSELAISTSHELLDSFSGLDIAQPDHLLRATVAINQVLFSEEGLTVNSADPYDPLNGSVADVMDTRKGNQYSLAMIYLHVANGLGLPCAVVGSPQHILLRIGHPSCSQHSSSIDSSKDPESPASAACFLVDVSNGGQIYAWPGKLHTVSSHEQACPASTTDGPSSASAQTALPDPMDTASADDDITGEWHNALRSWQLQFEAASSSSTDRSSVEASVLSDVADSEAGSADSSWTDWQQVEGYSAVDAATRNSWKALYGPGSLVEWGGLVSSSSSSQQYSDYVQFGLVAHSEDSSNLHHAAATADNTHFGILDSPFVAAAGAPFTDSADVDSQLASGDGSSSIVRSSSTVSKSAADSMDVCCSSDTEPAERELNRRATVTGTSTTNSSGRHNIVQPVALLCEHDVRFKYGGLAPVRARVLLQQMLAGMKLSLLLSGRQDEALAVIRYLRATDPFSLPDLRDEALILANAHNYEEAAQLLCEYLAVAPGASDAGMVGEVLQQVQLAAELARARARKQQ